MSIFTKLLKSSGLRQTMVLTGGNFVATFFSAIGLLLISRSLGPIHFGEFTVGYSLMIIIVRFQGLGLNVAIQKLAGKYFNRGDGQEKLNQLFQVGSTWNLGLLLISLAVGLLLAQPLANLLHVENLSIIWGSFIFAGVTLLFEYLTTIFQVIHRFSESVYIMLVQALLKMGVAIGVFLTGTTQVVWVFYLFYLVPVIGIGLGILRLGGQIKILPLIRNREIETQLTTVMKHSAVLMVTAGLIDYIDVLFVKHYATPLETGVYGGISQLASAVGVIAFSLASVLNARVARYHTKAHLESYIKKALAIAGFAVLGFALYVPFTELSIQLTLGSEYMVGSSLLAVLMLASFILLATVPFIALFYSFETHTYFSISGLGQLAIAVIGGNYLISQYGLEGAVWTKVITRVFLLAVTLIWAFSAYRHRFKTDSTQLVKA